MVGNCPCAPPKEEKKQAIFPSWKGHALLSAEHLRCLAEGSYIWFQCADMKQPIRGRLGPLVHDDKRMVDCFTCLDGSFFPLWLDLSAVDCDEQTTRVWLADDQKIQGQTDRRF